MGLALVAVTVIRGLLIAQVLAAVLLGNGGAALSPLLLGASAAQAGRSVLLWLRELVAQRSGAAVKARLREILFTRLLVLGPDHATSQRSGRLQALLVDGVEGLESYFVRYVPQLAVTLVGPFLIVMVIASADPLTGATLAGFLVVVPALPRVWDRLLARRADEYWEQYRGLAADYIEAMQAMPLLVVSGAAPRTGEVLAGRSSQLLDSTMRQMSVSLVSTALSAGAATGGVALTVVVGAVRTSEGALAPDALLVVLLLAGEAFRPFVDLASYWHSSYLGVAATRGIATLMERPTAPAVVHRWGASTTGGAISLRDVHVCWPGRAQPALDGLDLEVADGEVVGLVGPSGAGKSTLLAVLSGFVSPHSGQVRIAGHDLHELDPRSLRALVTVVPQHPVILSGSIADNIRLGSLDADDEAVHQAAQAAGLDLLLARLPGGVSTQVGDRGGRLSGGERQRLALARALLIDPPVLALDEVTSAVDEATERDLVRRIASLRLNRTTLIVAHRPGAIACVDRVVKMRSGRACRPATPAEHRR